jgi:hypothetical protein
MSTATNATSLISCTTSWLGCPVIAVLLARQVRQRRVADEADWISLDLRRRVDQLVGGDAGDRRAQDHARDVPHASVVPSSTASRRRQISGIDSPRSSGAGCSDDR